MKSMLFATICLTGVACVLASECLEEKAKAEELQQEGAIGVMMPRCDSNGDYEAKQCHASTGMCKCVRPNGSLLAGFSRTVQECNCFRHRDVASKIRMLGQFIPACEESTGLYKNIQCHENHCHCVNQVTGEKYGMTIPSMSMIALQC